MKLSISTPFPADSLQGNSVSARRIAEFLRQSDHDIGIFQDDFADDSNVLIALNAWRSAEVIKRYSEQTKQCLVGDPTVLGRRKLVVMLTGSDLFPLDGILKPETLQSIQLADAVVVTHKESLENIDHQNIHEIGKSIVLPEIATVEKVTRNIPKGLMVAHLREQKNPFLFLRAIPYMKQPIRVEHYGDATDSYQDDARRYTSEVYEWQGLLPRVQLLEQLAAADFLLNTSYIEGSSNSLCEAVMLGVPVIVSAIPGNIGVVGDRYPGLFDCDNPHALALLLDNFAASKQFRDELHQACAEMVEKLLPAREKKQWADLIDSFM